MSLLARLDKTVVISSQVAVRDAIGGYTNTYSTTFTGKCLTYPVTSRIAQEFDRDDIKSQFECVTATPTDAAAGNIATIDGATYEVMGYKPFTALAMSRTQVYVTILGKRNQT